MLSAMLARLRKLRNRLVYLAPLLLAAPLGIELTLRLFQPASMDYYRAVKELHVSHPDYLVGLAPNTQIFVRQHAGLWQGQFTINSYGYRGTTEPDPARPQIACLGDSLVMGLGVSDEVTFCSRIDGIRLGETSYQSVNLGVDAFGSRGYALRLQEAVDRLNLKIVLLVVSPNDYAIPPALAERGVRSDDEIDAQNEGDEFYPTMFAARFALTRYSYLLHSLVIANQQLRIRAQLARNDSRLELIRAGVLSPDPGQPAEQELDRGLVAYLRGVFYRPAVAPPNCGPEIAPAESTEDAPVSGPQCPEPVPAGVQCQANEPDPATLEPLMEITRRYYAQMISLSRERGFRLVVVFMPIQNEVLYCEMNGRYSRFFDYALRARQYFQNQGVPVLDLRSQVPGMCGEPVPEEPARLSRISDYYIPGDGHLTRLGNAWAARALEHELQNLANSNAL